MLKSKNIFLTVIGFFWGISIFPSVYHFHFVHFIKSGNLDRYTIILSNGRPCVSNIENFLGSSGLILTVVIMLLLVILWLLQNERNCV